MSPPDLDRTVVVRHCPRCERPLPADAPEGLCAACLLEVGMATLTRDPDDEGQTIASMPAGSGADIHLTPGQIWGRYRIGRLLGRGGMGEVYEAEQIDSGRRLALKVLRGQLQDAGERARFLREGQLAASVSHPHTVYIFGSEEIDGVPVITMELLPGGTLKDRVAAEGPLSSTDAVGAVLDIIGGLDAAQAAGILHRDIKPSNCFTDIEGSVKVGDFGLSISTLARDVHHDLDAGGFQGTPQFAPPEQLRGEPLDVRADIYAVGATLYYLLTGQAPFDGRDLRELFARVSNEPAKSPRALRSGVPTGLATVVLRCLAKTPADRPASYAALADALRPFLAQQATPANPGLRLMAGVIDSLLVSWTIGVWRLAGADVLSVGQQRGGSTLWPQMVLVAVYFLVLETFWGGSIGKRLFRMRVATQRPATLPERTWRIALRTGVYSLPDFITFTLVTALNSPLILSWGTPQGQSGRRFTLDVASLLPLILTALLFAPARRRNGWMAAQDWLSGTRVVAQSMAVVERRRQDREPALPNVHRSANTTFGPFTVLSDLGGTVGGGYLFLGFDPALRRQVWIHRVPAGTAPTGAARRDVSRIGRLHWLTGRRSSETSGGNWDAFEAPSGEPLTNLPAASRRNRTVDWPTVKVWLLDLANELVAAERDGSMPALGVDRLWLRTDGHIVLLDFPSPSAKREPNAPATTPVGLLAEVGRRCLQSGTDSNPSNLAMPLSARTLVRQWSSDNPPSLADAHRDLQQAAAGPDRVSRFRRAVPIGFAAVPALIMSVVALLVLPAIDRFFASDAAQMMEWLSRISEPSANSRLVDASLRHDAEIYTAGRFAKELRDENFWRALDTQPGNDVAVEHRLANTLVDQYPSVAPEDLQRAAANLAPEIKELETKAAWHTSPATQQVAPIVAGSLCALGIAVAMLFSLLSSIVVPGGILTRLLGHAVITRRGIEIGRLRSVARTAIAWMPAVLWMVVLLMSKKMQGFVPNPSHPFLLAVAAIGALAVGAAWTIVRPARGPHDVAMGTAVVPR